MKPTGRWRFDIKYGPEGEANYAWVYDEAGRMICTARTHDAARIVEAVNAYAVNAYAVIAAKAAELAALKASWRKLDDAANEWADRAHQAEAQLAETRKALEPFAEVAGEPWADENGWTKAACQNDRICDWFGPSAFLAARRACEAQGGE